MKPTLVHSVLSAKDQETVIKAIEVIEEKLPFLIHLSADDRQKVRKLGPKPQVFVHKAIEVAEHHPSILPVALADALETTAKLVDDLTPILFAVRQLSRQLDDTVVLAGSEALSAARVVYALAKTDFAGAALEAAASDLGKAFARKAPRSTDAQAAPVAEQSAPAADPAAAPVPAAPPPPVPVTTP